MKNVKETLEAINKLMDNNVCIVNTKRIRRCYNIKSSNRSKINFIWRSLDFLAKEGILEENGILKPKTYKIKVENKIDVDKFINQIDKDKK
ncbi:MAG: hypothetical protein ACFFDK_01875 [Promethearchaeota archaeon]